MMEDNTVVATKEKRGTMKTPGTLLAEARSHKKLTPQDVAKQLRLNSQWIEAIEKDDYSHGAALIYVRGYLRSYARFIGISPDEVVGAFDALSMDEEFAQAKSQQQAPVVRRAVPVISRSTRVLMNRRTVHWITAAAFAMLVVLGGVWWQGQKKHTAVPSNTQIDNSQQVAMPPTEDSHPLLSPSSPVGVDANRSTESDAVILPQPKVSRMESHHR